MDSKLKELIILGILILFLLAFLVWSSVGMCGPYIELYPKHENSKLFGPVQVVTCVDGDVVGTDCGDEDFAMYGSVVHITGGGTITLPEVKKGAWLCVKSLSTAYIHIDVYVNDRWRLDGVELDDGDKITSAGELDDTICFYGDSADGWTSIFNPHQFTDGGP